MMSGTPSNLGNQGCEFDLFFVSHSESIHLEHVHFSHPLLDKQRISRRGTSYSSSTFPGGSGVKALAVFLVEQKVSNGNSTLIGEAGSVAATLDSVISKQPIWLLEMLGVDSAGRTLLHRLVERQNPERKRPGPVKIYLVKEIVIRIFVNDIEQRTQNELREVLDNLTSEISKGKRPSQKILPEGSASGIDLQLISLLENEAQLSLAIASDRLTFRRWAQNLAQSPTFKKMIGRRAVTILQRRLERNISASCCDAKQDVITLYKLKRPLIVAMNPWEIGSIITVRYLSQYLRAPIFIDHSYESSYFLFKHLELNAYNEDGLPDFISLGLGAIAGIEKERKIPYVPFLPLPPSSANFITKKRNSKTGISGELSVGMQEFSTSGMHIEDLLKKTLITKSSVSFVESISYASIFTGANDLDPETIFFTHFPHVNLNLLHNNFSALGNKHFLNGMFSYHESLNNKPEIFSAFSRLFLFAWEKLASDIKLQKRLVADIWMSKLYREQVYWQALGKKLAEAA
jgi:hypothetical protein